MIQIGMAAKDERGMYSGGAPGDQTGKEVYTRLWYNRPWDTVIRWIDRGDAEKFAQAIESICRNDMIGYSQSTRTTLWQEAARAGWNIDAVGVPCNCDCSSMMAVAARSIGLSVPRDIWTGNLESAFIATGRVKPLKDSKYLVSDQYIRRGDILLNTLHHVAAALGDGEKCEESTQPAAPRIDTSGYQEIWIGCGGAWVSLLQQALNARGFSCGVDGDFGPETQGQVISFQSSRGLVPDGIVGTKTWYALFNE